MTDSKLAIVLVRPSGQFGSLKINSSVLNLTSLDLWILSPVSVRLGLPLKVLAASEVIAKFKIPNESDQKTNKTPNQIANRLFVELNMRDPNFGNCLRKSFFGNVVVARADGEDLDHRHAAFIDSVVLSGILKLNPIASALRRAGKLDQLNVLQSRYTGVWIRKFWDSFCDFDSKQKDGVNAKATGNPFQAEDSEELKKLVEKMSTHHLEMMNFVTENMESLRETHRTCDCCGVTRRGLLTCGGCRKVIYCNKVCQKASWKEHKKVCGKE